MRCGHALAVAIREAMSMTTDTPIFGDRDFKDFADLLGVGPLSPELVDRLEVAALTYRFLRKLENRLDYSPTHSERRKLLNKAAVEARHLAGTLTLLHKSGADCSSKSRGITPDQLEKLANLLTEIAREIPRGGKNPENSRRILIRRLAEVYTAATGCPATRRHDYDTGKDYGPFLEFVRAVLARIDEPRLRGIEHVVRETVARNMKSDAR